MRKLVVWAPLAMFALFVLVVALRLTGGKDDTIRSQLIGQKVPEFALAPALPGRASVESAGFAKGSPRILNIFASWCVPCAAEAPQLMELKRRGIPIDAVAIRDRPEDVTRFLGRYGDPFAGIGSDPQSAVQLALGSAGVPETFVIDGRGVIRHQHIGTIGPEDVAAIVAAYEAAR